MAPVGPGIGVTYEAHRRELYRSRGGHHDVYQGGVSFDDVVRVEANLPCGTPPRSP